MASQDFAPRHTIPASIKYDLEKGLEYLKKNVFLLQRGDLVHFLSEGDYRNDGLTIFDGVKLVELDTDVIDYGTLPSTFSPIVEGEPLNYWHGPDGISHNDLIFVDVKMIKQCLIKRIRCRTNSIGEKEINLVFIHKNFLYKVNFHSFFDEYDKAEAKALVNDYRDFFENKDGYLGVYLTDPEDPGNEISNTVFYRLPL